MTPELLDQIGYGIALCGALVAALGAYGVLRFPDLYTRLHAASLTDTGGATLVLVGLALASGLNQESLKLGAAWVFLMLTGPTAAHAIANAAYSAGYSGAVRSPVKKAGGQ